MKFIEHMYFAANKINPGDVGIPKITDPNTVLVNVLNIVYVVSGMIAVLVVIIAGIRYTTSSGDSAGVADAKNQLMYGVIGIVIILSAFAITGFIAGSF